MDIQKVLENVVTGIMDCLEECFQTMTIASGKRLLEVMGVCFGLLVFSIVMKVLELPVFITWQEVSVACLIMGVIVSIDYVNKAAIKKVKDKFKVIKEGGSRK